MTNKKGQAAIVGTLIVVIVSLMIGLFVYAEVDSSIDESDMVDYNDSGNDESATYQGIVSNSNSAFDITSILPLVIGAAAILGVIAGGAFLSGRM